MNSTLKARRRVALPIIAGFAMASLPAVAQQQRFYGATAYGTSVVGAYNPYTQAGPGQTTGRAYGAPVVAPYPPAYPGAYMPQGSSYRPPTPAAGGLPTPYPQPVAGQVAAYNPWRMQHGGGGYVPPVGAPPPTAVQAQAVAAYTPYGRYTGMSDPGANLPNPPAGPIRSRILSVPEVGNPQGAAAPFHTVPYTPRRATAARPQTAPRPTQLASGGMGGPAFPAPTPAARTTNPPSKPVAKPPAAPSVAAAAPRPTAPPTAPTIAAKPPESPKPAPAAAAPKPAAPPPAPVAAAKPPEPPKPAPVAAVPKPAVPPPAPVAVAKPPEPPKPAPVAAVPKPAAPPPALVAAAKPPEPAKAAPVATAPTPPAPTAIAKPPEPPKSVAPPPAPAEAAKPPEPPKPAPAVAAAPPEPPKPAATPPAAKPPEPPKPASAVVAAPPVPPKPATPPEPPKPAPVIATAAPAPPKPAEAPPAPAPTPVKPVVPAATRVTFETNSPALSADARHSLDKLASDLLANPERRATLKAYSGGGAGAETRRLALARGLAVRAYLIDRGVPRDRLDVQALGASADGGPADRVDAVPGAGT